MLRLRPLHIGALLFFVSIGIVSLLYGYQDLLFLRPQGPHVWRQTDCLSLANSYFEDGAPFLAPEIPWTGENGNGKGMNEFPVIYKIWDFLWSIFGKSEPLARLFNFTILLAGLWALFRTVHILTDDLFWSVSIPIWVFGLPVIGFYGLNFLMEGPALGLVFLAILAWVKYWKDGNTRSLILGFAWIILAGLLKAPFFWPAGIFGLVWLFNLLFPRKLNIPPPKHRFLPIGLMIMSVGIVIGWVTFVRYFNASHNPGLFLSNPKPIWDLQGGEIMKTWKLISANSLSTLLYRPISFLFILFAIGGIFLSKGSRRIKAVVLSGSTSMILLYFLAFYPQFRDHEYYLIATVPLIPLILVTCITGNDHILKLGRMPILFKSIFSLLLILQVYYSAVNVRIRFNANDKFASTSFFMQKWGLNEKWLQLEEKQNNLEADLREIESRLDSAGLGREMPFISLSDTSTSVSLYLMNRKGFSGFGYENLNLRNKMDHFQSRGAKVLVIHQKDLPSLDALLSDPLFRSGKYLVFRLAD